MFLATQTRARLHMSRNVVVAIADLNSPLCHPTDGEFSYKLVVACRRSTT